jgi:hypothetical protein
MSVDHVGSWLADKGYADLVELFRQSGVDGAVLVRMDQSDLQEYVKESDAKQRPSMFYKNFITKRDLLKETGFTCAAP